MSSKMAWLAICVAALVLIAGQVEVASAVTCNPIQLSPCAPAISSSARPSRLCCARVRQQRPCLCGYLRNPKLQKFIRSRGARKVASYCRLPPPRC